MVEEFEVDAEAWDSVSASLYLTKRGEVYVVALEAGTLAGGDEDGGGPPPSPATIRGGGDGGGGTRVGDGGSGGGGCTRIIAAWATATVPNPDVPARLVLPGLFPERDYELYAYAENGVGGRVGRSGGGSGGSGCENTTDVFSVEPAPSGMSPALVAATRLPARTAREPDEELDVPWKNLSESEQMAEALAALADPLVARAAREAALDLPTAEDLAPGRCEANPVSRNKWRSFCRWWTTAVNGGSAGGGGGGDRKVRVLVEGVRFCRSTARGEGREYVVRSRGWGGEGRGWLCCA